MTIDSLLIENKGTAVKPLLTQCCVCREFKGYDPTTEQKVYFAPSEALRVIYESEFAISHSYCPDCFKSETERYRKDKGV